MIKAVYFDLDDTLISSTKMSKEELNLSNLYIAKVLKQNLTRYKNIPTKKICQEVKKAREYIIKKYSSNCKNQIDKTLKLLGVAQDPHIISSGIVGYHIAKHKFLRKNDKLFNFLNVLKKHFKLGIMTDGMTIKQWDKIIYILGPEQKFFNNKNTIISEKFGVKKPSKKLFLEIIKREKIKPEEVLYVGDRYENDILPAKKLGMKTALINNKNNKYFLKKIPSPKPDIVVNNLFALNIKKIKNL